MKRSASEPGLTLASGSIPNSVVWFLKVSRGRIARSLEEKATKLRRGCSSSRLGV